MVNWDATKLAVGVAAVVLAVLVAGQVLRLLTRMLAWGAMVGVVLAAAYVAYRLWSGWSAAGEAEEAGTESLEATDRVSDARERYLEGQLTEAEFERELERAMDGDDPGAELEEELTLERE